MSRRPLLSPLKSPVAPLNELSGMPTIGRRTTAFARAESRTDLR